MKAVCISNFHYYDIRMKDVMAFFTQRGYEVHYVTGDYDTMSSQPYVLDVPRTVQIPLVRYRKNISLEHIWSHWRFARAVYKQLQRLQPDVIYAMVPPNFVAHYVALYKRKHPHVVIYYDVFDMWPESFPSTTQKNVCCVDCIISEHLRHKQSWYGLRVASFSMWWLIYGGIPQRLGSGKGFF